MVKWIFTHGDTDGTCAGALASSALQNAKIFFTNPYGLLRDLDQVQDQDSVLICDIALASDQVQNILQKFASIEDSGSLTYIDHHPLPQNISEDSIPGTVIHSLKNSGSELVYTHLRPAIDSFTSRLAIYGAIADYLDDTTLITRLLSKWDKRTICFESGILVQGLDGIGRNYEFKRELISKLAKGYSPSSIQELVDAAIQITRREEAILKDFKKHIRIIGEVAYVLNLEFSLSKMATYAKALGNSKVGLAGEERNNSVDMSLRTDDPAVDLNRILQEIAPLFNGSGGGHPVAAGARLPKDYFPQFISELNKRIIKTKSG